MKWMPWINQDWVWKALWPVRDFSSSKPDQDVPKCILCNPDLHPTKDGVAKAIGTLRSTCGGNVERAMAKHSAPCTRH